MFIQFTVGAIFIVFILCVHCDNAANNNEIKEIIVPSAPQNLTTRNITSTEIHLSWSPPTDFTRVLITQPKPDLSVIPKKKIEPQSDAPVNDVIDSSPADKIQYVFDWQNNDKNRYQSDILNDSYKSKRDIRTHRHRKRRQDGNVTREEPIEVVKKAPAFSHKDASKIAFVLYYEQGVPRYDLSTVNGVQTPADVKKKNVFPSDLGMEEYSKATKNLTLTNKSGYLAKFVYFQLKTLKPFTPYKIWVRAFYNASIDTVKFTDLKDWLSPLSEPLYVLTDVAPPTAPQILNLTCETRGILYIQWRQPIGYNNSLNEYTVTLNKLPESEPRTLRLPTNVSELETTISMPVEITNSSSYEVKIVASTISVVRPGVMIKGLVSKKEVSSDVCTTYSESLLPEELPSHSAGDTALFAVAPIALIAAVLAALIYCRCRSRLSKCISAAYNFLEEGGERARPPMHAYKKPVVDNSPGRPRLGSSPPGTRAALAPRVLALQPPVRAAAFPNHVQRLHADGDIGFSKEYEIVVSKSAALGHTSHHSHRPENKLKNRYLNITAYDHSRVCVSSGSRCGALGCAGRGTARGKAAPCDYVNANYIDGILPHIGPNAAKYIKKKLEARGRINRQPSIKQNKPPPNLTEGIESAFLNIEFSGIVESDEHNEDSDSDPSDDDDSLDDVCVDIEGEPTRIRLEWALWRRRYIATQGPTPATLDAFWRMLWQHGVRSVVMITNLVERGRRKCDMYWPGGGRGSSVQHGGLNITMLAEDVRAAYTVRHMRVTPLSHNNGDADPESPVSESDQQGRIVVQYHYTVWPDHGTPRHPLAVLPFVKAASSEPHTVLVHCSAGVGRTGTYIVLDAQLNQLKLTGTLSPLGFLCRARTQRNHLVQTEEQYIFVHDALVEHVRSGDTEVDLNKAKEYLAKLLEPITEDELAVLDIKKYEEDNESVKSSCSERIVENGSQMSIKTDDLNSEMSKSEFSKSSVREGDEREVNGEETEGVYDLAPRSTDSYTKKMEAYNNMSEQEKEEIRRANRVENYALLERMRSLANRHHTYQGPPPVNLLEKQFLLITRSCAEPSACASAAHNAHKNRAGAALPSDAARVLLVPKPGVEGSEYINASWVCGKRRMREYCVTQHPVQNAELWRLLWDHTAQLVLTLPTSDEECEVFWPTEDEQEMFVANFRASFVSKEIYVAYRKSDKQQSPAGSPVEPEVNGFRRQESDCADDERLIPENNSPILENEPAYRFDRTELKLERLSTGARDLSARKSIANGDLFSSYSEKRNGPKSPKSPSKMSLKNFKLGSPTKFKFPEWGHKTAVSPPDIPPPPPPVAPALSVEEEAELCRPYYCFEKVDRVPEDIPLDRVIEVTNVSVHSLQDDYQLSVKFIKCENWMEGDTTEYIAGRPEENEFIRDVKEATCESEREEAIERLIEPYKDTFALIEFVAGCQMEYKNGPVVVVDKYGASKAMNFCTLSAAAGGAPPPLPLPPHCPAPPPPAPLYSCAALAAHARCAGARAPVHTLTELLAMYCALAGYCRTPDESQTVSR